MVAQPDVGDVKPTGRPFDADAAYDVVSAVPIAEQDTADMRGYRYEEAVTPDASAEDREWAWERAVARLVTLVLDRTSCEAGWYGHCELVLRWYLESNDVEASGRRSGWRKPSEAGSRAGPSHGYR